MKRFTAIWKYTASVGYTDLTSSDSINESFSFISTSSDEFYLGLDSNIIGIYADLSTNGEYTSLSFTYKSDSDWKVLNLIDSYSFSESKYLRWVLPSDAIKFNFTEVDPYSFTPPDTIERYWIKISCSGVITPAVISKLRAITFATYTTPNNVAKYMQLRKMFDNDTNPTDRTIEDFIRRAEDRIDYRTKKSWRFNAVTDELDPQLVDYNRYGVFMRHRNFMKVYSVSIWTGNDWQILVEGRNNDYFVNYNLGMLYLTRLFLLPAAYGMTGRYFHWGFGEFKNSMKIDYIYGRDLETDPEYYMIEGLTNKIVARELWTNHDYSDFIVSGTDKVSLESKVRQLDMDIEKELEELTGVSLY